MSSRRAHQRRQRRRGGPVSRAASPTAEVGPDADAGADSQLVGTAVGVGILTGGGIVALNKAVGGLQDLIGDAGGFASTPGEGALVWGPLVGAVVVSLVILLLGEVDGTTLPTVRAVAAREDGAFASSSLQMLGSQERAKRALLRLALAATTLGSGNSLGPEGPSVEFGANVAAALGCFGDADIVKTAQRRLGLLACGCAAGVAAGFNAPVAGLFFAVEVVKPPQGEQPESVVSRLLASGFAATVVQIGLGSSPLIQGIEFTQRTVPADYLDLPVYLLLGAVCGAMSALFGVVRDTVAPLFTRLSSMGVARSWHPLIGSLSVCFGVSLLGLPELLFKEGGSINGLLDNAKAFQTGRLFEMLFGKMVLSAICVGSGLVGGLFAPALFMGAVTGLLFGQTLEAAGGAAGIVFSGATDFAAVGAAASLGATCGVPLTAVVLLLELAAGTDYTICLPLIVAVGSSVYWERYLTRSGQRITLSDVSSEALVRVSGLPPEEEMKAELVFQTLDRNRDGTVTRDEFREWLCSLSGEERDIIISRAINPTVVAKTGVPQDEANGDESVEP